MPSLAVPKYLPQKFHLPPGLNSSIDDPASCQRLQVNQPLQQPALPQNQMVPQHGMGLNWPVQPPPTIRVPPSNNLSIPAHSNTHACNSAILVQQPPQPSLPTPYAHRVPPPLLPEPTIN